VNELAVVVCIC